MSNELLNLTATIVTGAGDLVLGVSLGIAAWRNHLRGKLRPSVMALAAYFAITFGVTFLRTVTRVYVLFGGVSGTFVNSLFYVVFLGAQAAAVWILYGILAKAYPDNHGIVPGVSEPKK